MLAGKRSNEAHLLWSHGLASFASLLAATHVSIAQLVIHSAEDARHDVSLDAIAATIAMYSARCCLVI
jgi:hypothetical protein